MVFCLFVLRWFSINIITTQSMKGRGKERIDNDSSKESQAVIVYYKSSRLACRIQISNKFNNKAPEFHWWFQERITKLTSGFKSSRMLRLSRCLLGWRTASISLTAASFVLILLLMRLSVGCSAASIFTTKNA